jgi:hypothetical protein
MYASRELSVAAVRAHSKDSSARARYSAAVIISISESRVVHQSFVLQGKYVESPRSAQLKKFCDGHDGGLPTANFSL